MHHFCHLLRLSSLPVPHVNSSFFCFFLHFTNKWPSGCVKCVLICASFCGFYNFGVTALREFPSNALIAVLLSDVLVLCCPSPPFSPSVLTPLCFSTCSFSFFNVLSCYISVDKWEPLVNVSLPTAARLQNLPPPCYHSADDTCYLWVIPVGFC